MELLEAIKIAKAKLGEKYFENLELNFQQVDEENVLKVTKKDGKVTIVYNQLASLFRGLTIIKEKANEKEFVVDIKKHFTTNGYMHDCSRNGVVRNDVLKDRIVMLALMGMNRLLLYTEDTYKLEKYPYFGYLRGGYTKEDIKELVAYGEAFGVELIPCIQTLGHLERVLHWSPMRELSDGQSTLLIGEPKVYEFIEEMLKFCRECFNSTDIHIGMDESVEIGLGRYLQYHPYTDRVELFTSHIARVIEICKKYDFKPMIWSDMYFRLNGKDHEYYRDTPLPESTVKMVPKEVGLVYWDYYHDKKEIYDDMISYHKQTPNEIHFAGGAWRWVGFTPSNRGSFKNTVPALQSCVANKIKNVFVTAWGDNGNECSIHSILPVIAMYSNADYFDDYSNENIDSLLQAVEGEPLERMMLLDLPNMPGRKFVGEAYNPCKYLLYQDVLNSMFDCQIKPGFGEAYGEYAVTLDKASKESEKYGYVYKNLSLLCSVLELKTTLGMDARKAYKEGDKETLKKIAKDIIPETVRRLEIFNESMREQWMRENRPFGFDVVDGRAGYLRSRLNTAKIEIEQYLNGELDKIEELETEILKYDNYDYEIVWNWWLHNVTVHAI